VLKKGKRVRVTNEEYINIKLLDLVARDGNVGAAKLLSANREARDVRKAATSQNKTTVPAVLHEQDLTLIERAVARQVKSGGLTQKNKSEREDSEDE
jgi:hypothetical protein